MVICLSTKVSATIVGMTLAVGYIVHLVVRRHVDFGMTRSMMCMPAA
jgi:hypothetical protein